MISNEAEHKSWKASDLKLPAQITAHDTPSVVTVGCNYEPLAKYVATDSRVYCDKIYTPLNFLTFAFHPCYILLERSFMLQYEFIFNI